MAVAPHAMVVTTPRKIPWKRRKWQRDTDGIDDGDIEANRRQRTRPTSP